MRVTLNLPDDLYQQLEKQAADKTKPAVNKRIKAILSTFNDVEEAGDRYIIIKGKHRREIEAILQGTAHTADELTTKIKNMSTVSVGEHDMPFTVEETRQIQAQAAFWGEDTDVYVKRIVKEAFDTALGLI